MKAEDIDKLEAGRELDALIAENVMGWQRISGKQQVAELQRLGKLDDNLGARMHYQGLWVHGGKSMACDECDTVPAYSTDISASWEVVEKLRPDYDLHLVLKGDEWTFGTKYWSGEWDERAEGETAMLAICRFGLKAVASQQDSQALHFSGQFQPDEGNKRTVYHGPGRQQEGESK